MKKALFLDRDGVINVDHGYLYQAKDVKFVEGIFELCRRFQTAGYLLVVVTNQSGIGRGYYSEEDFHKLSQWMSAQFAEQNCHIEKFYFCPHHASKAKGEYLQDCDCRKPKPGMLLQAAKELDIDLAQSVFIGDKYSDMQAGNSAGIGRCVLLESSYLQAEREQNQALTQLDFERAAKLDYIEPE